MTTPSNTPVNTGSPATPPAGTNTADAPVTVTGNTEPTAQYVTPDQLDELRKRADAQSAYIARLEKRLEKLAEPAQVPAPAAPKPLPDVVERIKALEDRERVADERRVKTNQRVARGAIKGTLVEAGLDSVVADDLSDLLLLKHGNKITVSEDDESVSIAENENEPKPITDWVRAFLGTDRGKRYLPAKRNPAIDGGVSPAVTAAVAQLDSMNRDEVLRFAEADPEAALQLRTLNPEKWRAALSRTPRK